MAVYVYHQVISGRGFWFHGSKGETEVLHPGEFCHHEAKEPHSTRVVLGCAKY